MHDPNTSHKLKFALIIGALGVVYGDIGTSPLYALKEAFFGVFSLERSLGNVLGLCSLIFWTLMIIVTIKYIFLIMRADNGGEGGIFSLLALLRQGKLKKATLGIVSALIIIGAVLLYGDGVITPSISVLSAIEGLNIITTQAQHFIIPITLVILLGLFLLQKNGSGKVGKLFGPVMVLWFITIAGLGIPYIYKYPIILNSLNPIHAISFLMTHGLNSLIVLGAVVLCVTGAEALYADMGHFGRKSISFSWFSLIYPALILNYFGQGAKLLSGEAIPNNHLFYSLVPEHGMILVVILSTVATIIASQALISGAFSLTNQSISLGLFPRLKIVHTNPDVEGQIYIPFINWALFFGCALLVIGFKSSSSLAAAYGIAVTGTMVITTIAFFFLAYFQWRWKWYLIGPICLILVLIDLAFFGSNLLKVTHGGYIPLLVAVSVFVVMHTWEWGRKHVATAYAALPGLTVNELITLKENNIAQILNRSVVVLASRQILSKHDKIPVALDSFCHKWGVSIPKHIIFFSVVHTNLPWIPADERYKISYLQNDNELGTISTIQVFYGYMQTPNVRKIIESLKDKRAIKIPTDPEKWLILTSDLRFITKQHKFSNQMRLKLFNWILKLSKPIYSYLGLGTDPQVAIETINI